MTELLLARIAKYYSARFQDHGPTAKGVDWRDAASQELRFDQLLRVTEGVDSFSLLDYGCGYGALLSHERSVGRVSSYTGFDLSSTMLDYARTQYGGPGRTFTSERELVEPADFAVASGIFNVKLDHPEEEWRQYILETLDDLDSLALRGFAFNMLTTYSDADRMRPDLHYSEPEEMLRHCLRTYSRWVGLLHDYGLYEFTILVKK